MFDDPSPARKAAELPKSGDVTPPLDEFMVLYRADDNVWWCIECGHHQNLFEEAVARAEKAEAALDEARKANARLLNAVEAACSALDWQANEVGEDNGFTWASFVAHLQACRKQVAALAHDEEA